MKRGDSVYRVEPLANGGYGVVDITNKMVVATRKTEKEAVKKLEEMVGRYW